MLKCKFTFVALALISFSIYADNLTAILGQTIQVKFKLSNFDNKDVFKCNIDIFLPEGGSFQRSVESPNYDVMFDYTPTKLGTQTINWQGNFKRTGLSSLQACNGSGVISVTTHNNNETVTANWTQIFSKLNSQQLECVKYGLIFKQIKYQSIDPSVALIDINDPEAKFIFSKCDSFLQLKEPQSHFLCKLNGIGNTYCDSFYAVRSNDGSLKFISREIAIQLYLQSKDFTLAQVENAEAKNTRLAEIAKTISQSKQTSSTTQSTTNSSPNSKLINGF